jgi:hypothetical protein
LNSAKDEGTVLDTFTQKTFLKVSILLSKSKQRKNPEPAVLVSHTTSKFQEISDEKGNVYFSKLSTGGFPEDEDYEEIAKQLASTK